MRFLPPGVIDAGLAADRGIHLRQQRRRHLHVGDAALVAGGGKPGQIAHHAAAERDDRAIAPEAIGDQHIEETRDGRSVLCASPSGRMTSHDPASPEGSA